MPAKAKSTGKRRGNAKTTSKGRSSSKKTNGKKKKGSAVSASKVKTKMKSSKSKAASATKSKKTDNKPVYGRNEIRKDYLLDFEVLIAENRNLRPEHFKNNVKKPKETNTSPFLPGNEDNTPPEIGRKGTDSKWTNRWFENKFPLFNPEPEVLSKKYNPLLQSRDAKGFHEIIVGTPAKNKQAADFTQAQMEELLHTYSEEIIRHQEMSGTKYVVLFKNEGHDAGTSIIHEHSQLIAMPFVPPRIEEEIQAAGRYFRARKRCAYCDVIKEETKGTGKKERIAYENKSIIAICPYASRYNFEVWLFPKFHKSSFKEFLPKDYADLADALLFVLKRLKKLGLNYNYELHYEPLTKSYKERASGLHFHIEVLPRRQIWAGFELGSGILVNSVSPETAAKFYRNGK